jgi:putative transposase
VKYENVYLLHYGSVSEGSQGIDSYFNFYNNDRPHQALKYQTPAGVYFSKSAGLIL